MEYFDSHPTLDMVELYTMNELTIEDRKQFVKHLKSCTLCKQMTAELQKEMSAVQEYGAVC